MSPMWRTRAFGMACAVLDSLRMNWLGSNAPWNHSNELTDSPQPSSNKKPARLASRPADEHENGETNFASSLYHRGPVCATTWNGQIRIFVAPGPGQWSLTSPSTVGTYATARLKLEPSTRSAGSMRTTTEPTER